MSLVLLHNVAQELLDAPLKIYHGTTPSFLSGHISQPLAGTHGHEQPNNAFRQPSQDRQNNPAHGFMVSKSSEYSKPATICHVWLTRHSTPHQV